MGIEAADHITATVQVEDHRQRPLGALWAVQPRGQHLAIVKQHLVGGHLQVARRGRVENVRGLLEHLTRLVYRQFVQGTGSAAQAAQFGQFKEHGQVRMHRHHSILQR